MSFARMTPRVGGVLHPWLSLRMSVARNGADARFYSVNHDLFALRTISPWPSFPVH